jgi:hypothetical protein
MEVVVIVNVICSLSLILGGVCMKKYAKSTTDRSIGFRTQRSMSSQEAWSFANEKCGNLWIWTGAISFVICIIPFLILRDKTADGIIQVTLLILQTAATLVSAAVVEKQLKNKFGNR